jgi:cytoskeletal protein CcmA (bactofilin family)
MAVLAFVILLLLTSVVCLAPLFPAWQEWRLRRDALPLGIEQSEYTSVRVFAERFRNHVQRELVALETNPNGDKEYLLITDNNGFTPARLEQSGQRVQRRVISDCALQLPDGYAFEREVYGRGDVHSGRRTRMRAALADARLDLGEGSVVLRWADAMDIHVAPQARLLGRASAARSISLAPGSEFRRLHAPSIEFGAALAHVEQPSEADPLVKARASTYERFGPAGEQPRWLVRDELSVPDSRKVECALVVRGRLNIGTGAYLTKGIKSYKDIVIGDGAIIDGAIVSRRDITIGGRCVITGPIVAQGRITIGPGCRFGSAEQSTTVSADRIGVAPGAVIHGTVWARELGETR